MSACASTASLNSRLGGESLGSLVNIEHAHLGSGTAVLAIAASIACHLCNTRLFCCAAIATCAAITAACADACTCTAATVSTSAAVARS